MKTIRSSGAVKCESRSVMSVSLWPHGLCSPWNSLGQNTGVSSLSLLQGIFPNQGLIPGLPHCRTLYQLSLKGSPRILEWAAYSFSSRSSQPRNQTRFFCIAGGFFTSWATRETLKVILFLIFKVMSDNIHNKPLSTTLVQWFLESLEE